MPHAAAADMDARETDTRASRSWHAALYALLVLTFITGGSSQEHGWTDAGAQLFALPILLAGLLRIPASLSSHVLRLGLITVAGIALLPWLQLVALPDFFWNFAPARAALTKDLTEVGVTMFATTWSLTSAATLRGALTLLPAVALFIGVLSCDVRARHRLLALCVALPISSLVLGFLQLGAPQESLLNPFPQWAPAMGGVFANPNHQGTAMLVGLGVCLAYAVYGFGDRRSDVVRNPWPALMAGVFLLVGLPLTNSRSVVVIGVLMMMAAPLLFAGWTFGRSGRGIRSGLMLALAAAIAALGLYAATGWMKVDEVEEIRWLMRHATFALAELQLPWGSGVGSFVPIFQQAAPDELLMPNYINAAHNDIAQVWLESGLAGAIVAACAIAALVAVALRQWREGGREHPMTSAALLGLIAVLAHSFVDYPLRTPAMLAMTMLLAGLAVAQASTNASGENRA